MDKMIFAYVRTHTVLILTVLISAFVLLAGGEFILYRKVSQLNRMISEGFMQVKENRRGEGIPQLNPSQKLMLQPTK